MTSAPAVLVHAEETSDKYPYTMFAGSYEDASITINADYILMWKTLVYALSQGEMRTVSIDMVNHVLDGTGADYYNAVLTNNIANHNKTDEYLARVSEIINTYIEENNGDISGLAFIDGTGDEHNSGVMVSKLGENSEIVYNDKFNGLGICVDNVYGHRIEMTSYSFDGQQYEYTLRFTLYDIYGLDSKDIEELKAVEGKVGYGILPGFRSWYILQHCNFYQGNQPFITYMVFEKPISGELK